MREKHCDPSDNCAFNRPFDDQSQIRIRLESEAKLYIQEKIKQKKIELVWSYILDFENAQNPFEERKRVIEKWKNVAVTDIETSYRIIPEAIGWRSARNWSRVATARSQCDGSRYRRTMVKV